MSLIPPLRPGQRAALLLAVATAVGCRPGEPLPRVAPPPTAMIVLPTPVIAASDSPDPVRSKIDDLDAGVPAPPGVDAGSGSGSGSGSGGHPMPRPKSPPSVPSPTQPPPPTPPPAPTQPR